MKFISMHTQQVVLLVLYHVIASIFKDKKDLIIRTPTSITAKAQNVNQEESSQGLNVNEFESDSIRPLLKDESNSFDPYTAAFSKKSLFKVQANADKLLNELHDKQKSLLVKFETFKDRNVTVLKNFDAHCTDKRDCRVTEDALSAATEAAAIHNELRRRSSFSQEEMFMTKATRRLNLQKRLPIYPYILVSVQFQDSVHLQARYNPYESVEKIVEVVKMSLKPSYRHIKFSLRLKVGSKKLNMLKSLHESRISSAGNIVHLVWDKSQSTIPSSTMEALNPEVAATIRCLQQSRRDRYDFPERIILT